MKSLKKCFEILISVKTLIVLFTSLFIVGFCNYSDAQSVKTQNPQTGTSLSVNDGGIDKSKLNIHDNMRDGAPHHINNHHKFVKAVHHKRIAKNFHKKTLNKGKVRPERKTVKRVKRGVRRHK